ncbi:DUF1993 domain-containing protein [Rhabdaerophilum sp. SD176]|uniref:DUF1993 domain-containing protein n=1 Tax=Rhabdaerophilum sp. SD176 TaxID=2983548 RepID=UPI0024E02341|nr:DUF1993 domain-containing protein [Rhabdaerophilum sp. SD176]
MSTMTMTGLTTLGQTLDALVRILDKLAAHAEARKIEEAVYLQARLYPDMFAFTRQIQIACDFAKGAAARMAGQEVPGWADEEKSIADLKARVERTKAFIAAIDPALYAGSDGRMLKIKLGRNAPELEMSGQDYFAKVVLPNFYFHASMAYAILRHCGVELGKGDFLNR